LVLQYSKVAELVDAN